MLTQIATWKNGDYAVISNSIGTTINFFGTSKIFNGELTLPSGVRAKSIYAIDIYQPDLTKPSIPMGLLILLMDGQLYFIGNIEFFLRRFNLKKSGQVRDLHVLDFPSGCNVLEAGVFEDNLILLTEETILLNRSAAVNCAVCTMPEGKSFLEIPSPVRNKIQSIAIGEKFLALLVEGYGVFVMSGAVAKSSAVGSMLFTHEDVSFIKFKTPKDVARGSTGKWMQIKFHQEGRVVNINQFTAHKAHIIARSCNGAVFSTNPPAQIIDGRAGVIAGNDSELYYIKDNQLWCCSAALGEYVGAASSRISVLNHPAENIIELASVVDRALNKKLLMLKQHANFEASGYAHRELVVFLPEGGVEQVSFPPAFSNQMPLTACSQKHNHIALWSNGACAVAVRDMVFVFGTVPEDQQQFGPEFVASDQFSKISKPYFPVSVKKIFAGEHAEGRALFILRSDNTLLARGALGPYKLESTQGEPIVNAAYLVPISLPKSLRGEITGIGLYQNAMIVLTEEAIFLNKQARDIYEFSGSPYDAGFLRLELPTLDVSTARSFMSSIETEIRHEAQGGVEVRVQSDVTDQKIVLGHNSFYILMPQGYVIEYVANCPAIIRSKTKENFIEFPEDRRLNVNQIFRIPNLKSNDKRVLIKDIQIIPGSSSEREQAYFLSTKGRAYSIMGEKIFQEGSFDKAAGLIAVMPSKLVFIDSKECALKSTDHLQVNFIQGIESTLLLDSAVAGSYCVFTYMNGASVIMLCAALNGAGALIVRQPYQVVNIKAEQFTPSLPGSPRRPVASAAPILAPAVGVASFASASAAVGSRTPSPPPPPLSPSLSRFGLDLTAPFPPLPSPLRRGAGDSGDNYMMVGDETAESRGDALV